MLVGEVGEDRDVVRDAQHPLELERVGGRLDHRDVVPGPRHRRERGLELRGAGGRDVRLVALPDLADPRLDRADQSRRQTGGLERGDREERGRGLAVGARDPDGAQVPGRVAVPPGGGPREGPAAVRDHKLRQAARRARPARRSLRSRPRPPRPRRSHARRRGTPGRPRTRFQVGPRVNRPSAPRTGTFPRPAAPIGRSSRRAPRTRPSASSRASSPASGRGSAGSAAATSASTRDSPAVTSPPAGEAGQRGSSPARPRSATAAPPARARRRARPTRRRTTACARTGRTSAHPAAVGAVPRQVHAAEVHLGASLGERELDRTPAQQVHRARVVPPPVGLVRGVRGGQSPAVAVQDEPAQHVARRRALPRLEVDEVPGGERARPPRHEVLGSAEPEPAPLPGGAEERVEPAHRRRRLLVTAHEALGLRASRVESHDDRPRRARHAGSAAGSPSRPPRGRAPGRRRRAAAAPSGGATAGSPGIAWKPAARDDVGVAPVGGRDLGIGRQHVHARRLEVAGRRDEHLAHRCPGTVGPRHAGRRPVRGGGTAEPPPTSGQRRTRAIARASPPARNRGCQPCAGAVRCPRPGLQDVAAGHVHRGGVPAVERRAAVSSRTATVTRRPRHRPAASQPRRSPPPTRRHGRGGRAAAAPPGPAPAARRAYVRRPSGSSTRSQAPT